MIWVDVGQAQAPVMAVEARLHWLENICPLQEVKTDHRRYQDWQLLEDRTGEDRKEMIDGISKSLNS